jgi:asparagine synthase (glutamine-hydrolysing)
MSAIFGIVHFDGASPEPADLARMSAALSHHGADGGGLWQDGSAALGQRLMRFTPQDAFERQPLLSLDRSLVLVSDARIDNRRELLDELRTANDDWIPAGTLPASLPSQSPIHQSPISVDQLPDSQLILRAYRRWGAACVDHLIGVFAFALWDTHAKTLFAARSPIVAPSLVYAATGKRFAFATMPSGLHALPFLPRTLNDRAVANLLADVGGGPFETLYHAVLRLPTGHWLLAGQDGVQVEAYWRPDLDREIRFAHDEAYLAAFNDLFARVVGDQLASVTPVAVQMSGGLDSAAIAAVAARRLDGTGQRLAAFTEVPRAGFTGNLSSGMYADETPYVQAIANMHANLDLNLLRTDGQIFLHDLDALFAQLEAPFRNTSNRVWIEAILGECRRRGMRVLLDGMQGNLTLSWGGKGLLPGLLRTGRWGQAARELRAVAAMRGIRPALRGLVGQGIMPLLPDAAWLAINRLRSLGQDGAPPWQAMTALHPAFLAAQGVPDPADDRSLALRARPTADTRRLRYTALAEQDFGAYLSAYRAMYGVDMRSPTADVRLAEFCLALPEEQYLRGGEARSLIRRAMTGALPPVVLANRKRGMQAADWFERLVGARALVGAELDRLERSELAQRVLDLKRMRRLYERLPTGDTAADPVNYEYRGVLESGLMVGRFLCWFEAG